MDGDTVWVGYALIAGLYLLGTLWALFNVLCSQALRARKILWVALLLLFPALGLFNWLLMGPRRVTARR